MAVVALQLLGFFLGLLGLAGTLTAALLPHWRSRAHVDATIITARSQSRGLWMACVWDSAGLYQCQLYRSLLALPADLQAARALMVLSCVASLLAAVVSVMGMKCTRFAHGSIIKSPLVLSGGACFLCGGVLCLLTVSWTTKQVLVDFYDPLVPGGMKYELGPSVYLGYASSLLSLSAALVLCWSGSGSGRHRRRRRPQSRLPGQRPASSPTAPFTSTCPPAPLYHPPQALKGNHAPSLHSSASSGYRLNNYV